LFLSQSAKPNDQTAFRQCLKILLHLREDAISKEILTALAEAYTPRIKKEKPQKVLARWMDEMNFADNGSMEKLLGMSMFHRTMAEWMDTIDFGVESDLKRCGGKTYTADAVTLMTLHGSKGLEFPVVMICGVRNRMIPLEYEKQDVNLEEERRLFYVGMTRAEEELTLITSSEPSPFLADIPQELLRKNRSEARKRAGGKQMTLLDGLLED
jgi:superfamily I DNA/RNA helicase